MLTVPVCSRGRRPPTGAPFRARMATPRGRGVGIHRCAVARRDLTKAQLYGDEGESRGFQGGSERRSP